MSHTEKKVYLNQIKERYLKSSKSNKKIILNEFCLVCGYNRKYATRILNKTDIVFKVNKKPGKKSEYNTDEFISALKIIWAATDYICSKRLKAAIPLWLPYYESKFSP